MKRTRKASSCRPIWCLHGWALTVLTATTLASEPTQRIFDSAHMLSPAKHAELQEKLAEFSAATGCEVFIQAETYLESGMTARTAARTARRFVSGSGPTALFLSDRAKDSIAISQSPEFWQRFPIAALVENLRTAMAQAQRPNLSPEERLTGCVETWLEGILRLETERQAKQKVLPPTQRPIAIAYASILSLGALATFFLGSRGRRLLAAEQHQMLFPEVQVGQRLGAPHGGGVIVSSSPTDPPQTRV